MVPQHDQTPVSSEPDRLSNRFRERIEQALARDHDTIEPAPPSDAGVDARRSWARRVLAQADPVEYYEAVSALARPTQTSMLTPMDYDAAIPYHQPMATHVEPDPQGIDTVRLYARTALPEFDDQMVAPFADPSRADLLNDIRLRLMLDGRNLALVTNHGDIVDIALVLAGLVGALCDGRTYGVLDRPLDQAMLARHMNIMVSRMVTTRAAFGIPAVNVISTMARTYLSLPQTHSRRKARLDPDLVRASNLLMREDLDAALDRGGQLLAMAASGSQDLSVAANLAARVRSAWRNRRTDEPTGASLHLQPLYQGTMRIMIACGDVLPLAVSMDPDHPALVIGSITRVETDDDCHGVMDWIARSHERATGITTVYHDSENNLLQTVRSSLSR